MTMNRKALLSLGLALALAAFSLPAFAGGPLAVCDDGVPYLWPAGGSNIVFNPDQGPLGPLTNAQAVTLVGQAFGVWEAVPSSTVAYSAGAQLPVDVDISNFGPYLNPVAPDGLSAVVFDDTGDIFNLLFGPGSGVLGFAGPEWINTLTCEILEGVSFLNGASFGASTAAFDVSVHEFGHWTNLAHTVVNGQAGFGDNSGPTPFDTFGPFPDFFANDVVETMYPFYYGPGSNTGTLEADDIAMVSTLYPEASFFASTGSISGTILAPNGTTRLTGVNVIARNVANPFEDAVSAISSDFQVDYSQANPGAGTYAINGLTPGASYAVFVDEILAGGFSTPPLGTLPGPEEFWNGAGESNDGGTDDPSVFTAIAAAAGSTASGTNIIFNAPPPGVIVLTDDDTEEIFLPFTYTICGQSFDSVFVNSNGSISFGAGSTDFSESAAELLSGPPRIAGLWDDLNPSAGGTISYAASSNRFSVTFDAVPEFPATGANTFTIELKRSANHIDIDWGTLTATDGLAGVSCGGAITSGFEPEIDLSAVAGNINMNNTTAAYEIFQAADNDLSGDFQRFVNSDKTFTDAFEPNDTLATAAAISLPFDTIPVSRYTTLSPTGGDVDYFSFSADASTTLVAEILTGAPDTIMGLFDSSGTLVAFDDDGGTGLLSRIVYAVPVSDTYTLAVSSFNDGDFSGDGSSGGRYVLDVFSIDGIILTLGDDTSTEVPLGFVFPFQGGSYTSVFVNSNGNLTFGAGSTDFSESVSDLLNGPPRIAALWDDLSPNNAGLVLFSGDATEASVSFIGVPEFISTGSNTFTVTLRPDGSFSVAFDGVTLSDAIVGVTEGGGAADPGGTDLSAAGALSATGTTYQQFTFSSPFDLDGMTLDFNP